MNVSRSALLPYTASQMYCIITDIRSYPEFLNWCSSSQILNSSENEMVAKLNIAYGKLKLGFTTRNELSPNKSVAMTLVDGPFSNLNGQWVVQELDSGACKVSLEMDFNFKNFITQKLFGRVFQNVIAAQLDAFQKRADFLYAV